MERLTVKSILGGMTIQVPRQEAINRLAAYEDTGLEPEEVEELRAAYNETLTRTYGPFRQKISQWIQAEKDGRLVVLPCGEGDELTIDGLTFKADHWNVFLTVFANNASAPSGKIVKLLYPEEAEAALEKREGTK